MLTDYVHIQVTEKEKIAHEKKVFEFVSWMERELGKSFTEQECIRVTHHNRFAVKRYLQDGLSINMLTCSKRGREIIWTVKTDS